MPHRPTWAGRSREPAGTLNRSSSRRSVLRIWPNIGAHRRCGGGHGGVEAGVGERGLGHDRVPERRGHPGGRSGGAVVGGPRLLEDEDVGVEVGALGDQVEGATPAVDPHVDVEAGHPHGVDDPGRGARAPGGPGRILHRLSGARGFRPPPGARPGNRDGRSRRGRGPARGPVRPDRSAAPCSVMTTPVWCRGVETTDPSGRSGTIRDRVTPLDTAVDRRQISEWSSRRISAPATKSSWPPTPEIWRPSMLSATTWPYRSTLSAPLMDTKAWFWAMTVGSLTTWTGTNATSSFPSSQRVELGGPEGEGGDGDAVEQALGVVGDLAGLVEPHEAVGEHLGVDPVAAAGASRRAWWPPCSAPRRCRSGGWPRR